MKALITGINGFAGSHLAALLSTRGDEVAGISEKPEYRRTLAPEIPIYLADILDEKVLEDRLREFAPTHIFHLAGFASSSLSGGVPVKCLRVNAIGTANLLESVSKTVPEARVVVATSTHILQADSEGYVDENSQRKAENPYTISKLCASAICKYYGARGLDVIEALPTNHYGPGQLKGFVVSDFASQIVAVMKDWREPVIKVGNLKVSRDFLYVADVVRAYAELAEKGFRGESYCIGSGQPVKISRILDLLIELSDIEVEVKIEKRLLRTSENPVISVNPAKLQNATGWKPRTELRDGLTRTFEYWLEQQEK